jgi:Ca2+/Na+ antiporter
MITANLFMFVILAVVILGSAIMCVFTKRIMRAATFLLFVLFGVAGMFFLLDYTYLGAAQISVYAGGITMLYVFAIQLVSKRTLQGLLEHVKGSEDIKHGETTGIYRNLSCTQISIVEQEEHACYTEEYEQQEGCRTHDALGEHAHDG